VTTPYQSVQHFIDERLRHEGIGLVTRERFAHLVGRLLAAGVLWRDFSDREAGLYDEARQCEQLLREWFETVGFVLTHDVDAMVFRLYPPGEDAEEEGGVKRLKARLSHDFIACCIALRFLYTEGLTGKRELIDQQVMISLEELSQAVVALLGHTLPGSAAERQSVLRQLRKHRLIRFNDSDESGAMETVLSILRPVMSFVSDEALQEALQVAGRRFAPAKAPEEAGAPDGYLAYGDDAAESGARTSSTEAAA
jgi:hypothetical protein